MSQNLKPVNLSNVSAEVRPILEQVQNNLGFVPNLFGTFANHAEVLKSYLSLSEAFSKSGLSTLEQQVVALSVSRENSCEYCVAAHSAISAMSKLDERVISSLRNGERLQDTKLEALRAFTKRVVSARGWVDSSDLKDFLSAGYTESSALAVVLGVTMKTLSNYVNHLAGTELDQQFSAFAWKS